MLLKITIVINTVKLGNSTSDNLKTCLTQKKFIPFSVRNIYLMGGIAETVQMLPRCVRHPTTTRGAMAVARWCPCRFFVYF